MFPLVVDLSLEVGRLLVDSVIPLGYWLSLLYQLVFASLFSSFLLSFSFFFSFFFLLLPVRSVVDLYPLSSLLIMPPLITNRYATETDHFPAPTHPYERSLIDSTRN